MKRYTIIGGVNGTGKSSFVGSLKMQTTELGIIIDPDKITSSVNGNIIQGARIAIKQIENCIEKGISFTQETTLTGAKTTVTAKMAKEKGYYIKLYYIGLDSQEESIKRIKNRVEKGGHNIPEADVKRRYENRFKTLKEILPYCDEAIFVDNYNGYAEIAEYKNGELIIKVKDQPEWIKEVNKILSQTEMQMNQDEI